MECQLIIAVDIEEDLQPSNSSVQQLYYTHVGVPPTWQQPQHVIGTVYVYSSCRMLCICYLLQLWGVMCYTCFDIQTTRNQQQVAACCALQDRHTMPFHSNCKHAGRSLGHTALQNCTFDKELNRLHHVETRLYCPKAFLSLNFHSKMGLSEFK